MTLGRDAMCLLEYVAVSLVVSLGLSFVLVLWDENFENPVFGDSGFGCFCYLQ